jgi:hypothetical protein
MSKAIISLKANKINSESGIDSISSFSILINKIIEGGSFLEFKKIIILHDNYNISKEHLENGKNWIEEISAEIESSETVRIHPENLKNYISYVLSGITEIYIVSGFSDIKDQKESLEWINEIFDFEKIHVFNSIGVMEKKDPLLTCQDYLKNFLKYIA